MRDDRQRDRFGAFSGIGLCRWARRSMGMLLSNHYGFKAHASHERKSRFGEITVEVLDGTGGSLRIEAIQPIVGCGVEFETAVDWPDKPCSFDRDAQRAAVRVVGPELSANQISRGCRSRKVDRWSS